MDHLYYYFFIGKLQQGLLHGFHTTLYIGLDDQVQFLQIALLDLAEQIIQGHLRLGILQQLLLILCNEGIRKTLCILIICVRDKDLTRIRYIVKTKDLHRNGRTCFFHTASLIIHHRTHLTMGCACRDKVTDMQCTFLYQYGCYRTTPLIQLGLDHQTSCPALRICFQFQHVCGKQDHFQQVVNAFAGLCGNRNEDRRTAPVFCNQFVLGQFLFYSVDICARLIDLVDCNDDLDAGCLCMVDRFYGLRHNTVIRCDYQDRDIRGVCATHTHGSKCFVSRRIQEGDHTIVYLYRVCADMLCDTAGLTVRNVCLTDRIQKGSLTMVNVTHNADDRRSLHHLALFLVFLL